MPSPNSVDTPADAVQRVAHGHPHPAEHRKRGRQNRNQQTDGEFDRENGVGRRVVAHEKVKFGRAEVSEPIRPSWPSGTASTRANTP